MSSKFLRRLAGLIYLFISVLWTVWLAESHVGPVAVVTNVIITVMFVCLCVWCMIP